jgi:hypothetical protein
MALTKVIVSHKRHDTIITHKIIPNCVVCIPESQLEDYKLHNPDLNYVTHPDEVKGSSPKRQWIYEKFGDCFMIDDDIMSMTTVYQGGGQKTRVLKPEEIEGLIEDLYHMAKETGVFLFGFNRSANPVSYTGGQPIKTRGFITGGAYGLIKGSKIFFPDYWDFVGDDYFLNAINAYYHRKCLIDDRFAFAFAETEHRQGGVADYRTEEKRKETYLYLKKHFGDSIIPKKPSPVKPNIMKWEKTLKIKF